MSPQRAASTHKFVSAVVLAAGRSTRMRRLKQLEKVGRLTLLERVLRTVKRSRADEGVVVLGHRVAEIRRKVDFTGLKVVINKGYRQGMSASLRLGLAKVNLKSDGAVIILADQPFLPASIVNSLIDAFQRSDCLAVVPTYRGVQRNPVLIDRRLFREIAAVSGDIGAKGVLERHRPQIMECPQRQPKPFMDIDTPKDLTRARRELSRHPAQSRKRRPAYENPGMT